MKRTALRSRPRNTGPTPEVVALVWGRDEGRCAACAGRVTGERGFDWSVHHRLGRKRGGTVRPFVNMPGNLVLLHGHGSALCHGDVGRHVARFTDAGLLVREGVVLPADTPIEHAVHGRVLLRDDGTWTEAP